jgi:hypothetical protein
MGVPYHQGDVCSAHFMRLREPRIHICHTSVHVLVLQLYCDTALHGACVWYAALKVLPFMCERKVLTCMGLYTGMLLLKWLLMTFSSMTASSGE